VRETTYEIRVRGRVSSAALERLEGLQGGPGGVETVLHGRVRDQAELHGLLARIRAHGLELVEVRRLPLSRSGPAPGAPRPAARAPARSAS
jgi:hypothetical protein